MSSIATYQYFSHHDNESKNEQILSIYLYQGTSQTLNNGAPDDFHKNTS